MARLLSVVAVGAVVGLLACATTVPEHHLSADQEQTVATADQAQAARQESEFRPGAGRSTTTGCRGKGDLGGACWTSDENPTEAHLRLAARLRSEATHHRAISRALVIAEEKKCSGLSEDDRDESPFDHLEDIESVQPLLGAAKTAPPPLLGATVQFRGRPGLSAAWLQRVMDCHLARTDALGHDLPDMPDCPMVPAAVRARVRAAGDGFAVDLTSDDPASAKEVLRRAQRLLAREEPPDAQR
jgi:hypothetical protein